MIIVAALTPVAEICQMESAPLGSEALSVPLATTLLVPPYVILSRTPCKLVSDPFPPPDGLIHVADAAPANIQTPNIEIKMTRENFFIKCLLLGHDFEFFSVQDPERSLSPPFKILVIPDERLPAE